MFYQRSCVCACYVTSNTDKRSSDMIYFDFSKAFDSVNHDIILSKLQLNFGVTGRMLSFIRNYLTGRTQRVVVGGKFSSAIDVLSGVPQGSILGPLLFLLFINDISSCVSGDCKIALYADDLKVWNQVTTTQDHIDMQASVDNLHNWALTNKMNFHPRKCQVISTYSPRCVVTWGELPFFIYSYTLGDTILDNVPIQKDLGVLVSNRLTWNDHAEHILDRFTDRFNLVRRTTYFVKNIHQRRVLYLTLVRSLLEHCSPVWAPQSVGMLDRFEAAQKRAVKWIYGVSHLTSWSNEVYSNNLLTLNILPIYLHFKQNDMKLMYKVMTGLIPTTLPDYLYIKSPLDVAYQTRHNRDIIDNIDFTTLCCSIKVTSSVLRNSFFFRSHTYWNSLPSDVRQSPTYSSFCYRLRKYLYTLIPILFPSP